MPTFAAGAYGISTDDIDIGALWDGTITVANSTTYRLDLGNGEVITFSGMGFTYNAFGTPTGGIVTGIQDIYLGQLAYNITGLSTAVTQFVTWATNDDNFGMETTLLGGADLMTGSASADLLRTWGGDDSLAGLGGDDGLDGGAGADSVFGGLGNDIIVDASGANYLRGDDGNDTISGGSDFDDINGNMGNDTAHGNLGDDWVVGGKDNDQLFGDDGGDIVYGNLGNDTCDGGTGADLIRGGQGNDTLSGGSGDDWISGDRGDDTMTGGTGADIFHTFGDAGVDRVLDFSVAQGDRVQLDAGTQYTVAQVGADTVISMTGGAQMILVGVQMSTLPTGWIFGN
jgi:Ca2+-binding RTX toxin-like protein